MRRREFITLLGSAAVLGPLAARAQQSGKMPRIGILAVGIPPTYVSRYEAFRQGLREFGYVEGQNIGTDYRYAEGKVERLPDLVAELVRLRVDLIVAVSAPEVAAAKRATQSIPIVFLAHGNPLQSGDAASLAKPGGNITGMAAFGPEVVAKRLELLKEAFPRITRVAVLWNAANPVKLLDWREAQAAARVLGVALQSHEVRGPEDFPNAFAAITKQRPDALMTLDDPLLLHWRASVVAFAEQERLPTISGIREWRDVGVLLVYGPNLADGYRRAAGYVAKILKGANAADLPIEQPTKFELIINLKTAKALGVAIPPTVLARADEVIE
jgi:putative ABC transport system substrate-binding protein